MDSHNLPPKVTLVVQVMAPDSRQQYIHRVGRTARCGKEGQTLLLLLEMEDSQLGWKWNVMKAILHWLFCEENISVASRPWCGSLVLGTQLFLVLTVHALPWGMAWRSFWAWHTVGTIDQVTNIHRLYPTKIPNIKRFSSRTTASSESTSIVLRVYRKILFFPKLNNMKRVYSRTMHPDPWISWLP